MINRDMMVEYLEPDLWTHLGEVLACLSQPGKQLHILHEGNDLTCVWEDGSPVTVLRNQIPYLWEIYPELEEIRVYTLEGLKRYYKKVQCKKNICMDTDAYVALLYNELECTEGISIYRQKKRITPLEQLTEFFCTHEGMTLLWLTKEGKLYFNMIGEVREHSLIRITTSDRYGKRDISYDEVCCRMKAEFQGPYHLIQMTMETIREYFGDKN